MSTPPPIALAEPMTADDVRLELLAQVLILGVAVAEARRRVEAMTLGDGVVVPTLPQCYRLVKAAKRDGTAQKIRKQWEQAQARKRKDHEAALKAEALRLIVHERVQRGEAARRLGVHRNTLSGWLTEPDAIEALMGEARVSAMMGALSLDDDIAKLRQYADAAEAEGELGLAASIRGKAADIELRRINGAAKVIVATQVNVNGDTGPDIMGILREAAEKAPRLLGLPNGVTLGVPED